jgi:hypothetical protein
MRASVAATQGMQQSINDEIAERIRLHQDRIVRLKAVEARFKAAAAPPSVPLVMLARGDSWFDYPLDGNGLSLSATPTSSLSCVRWGISIPSYSTWLTMGTLPPTNYRGLSSSG